MTKITVPETKPVEQAAKALLDALEGHEGVWFAVARVPRPAEFLATLRALAGDA